MLFEDIRILDQDFNMVEHCWVGTVDDRIAYVGTCPPENPEAYGEKYAGTNRLLMPGFFNAHAHSPMTILRGYGEALPLQEWLNDRIWPFEAKMTPEDNYWGTVLACAEMLRYGTVSFTDMYYCSEDRFRAVAEAGMKMNSSEGLLAFEPKPYSEYPICQLNDQLIERFHGSENGRLLVDYNIHAEYTSNPIVVRDIAQLAKERGLRIHLHASETKLETEECKQRHNGMTPIQYFESLGVFENPTTAAHCVWLEEPDFQILRDRGVFVATNPVSNMKLGSGFAPIKRMLDEGINVALGTDSCSSNNNHDMMQDMYVMALCACGSTLDPAAITPQQVLRAATRTGALSQGRDDCGLIAEGMKADLCVLYTSGPSWAPMTNAPANVVYAGHGSDVVLTMVDGSVRYRDGEWAGIDIERAIYETGASVQRIIGELQA